MSEGKKERRSIWCCKSLCKKTDIFPPIVNDYQLTLLPKIISFSLIFIRWTALPPPYNWAPFTLNTR